MPGSERDAAPAPAAHRLQRCLVQLGMGGGTATLDAGRLGALKARRHSIMCARHMPAARAKQGGGLLALWHVAVVVAGGRGGGVAGHHAPKLLGRLALAFAPFQPGPHTQPRASRPLPPTCGGGNKVGVQVGGLQVAQPGVPVCEGQDTQEGGREERS